MKSVRIRSYSGPHFPTFGLNTERLRTLHFLRSESYILIQVLPKELVSFNSRYELVNSRRCIALWLSFSRIRSSVFLFAPSDQMLRGTQTPEKMRSTLLWSFNSSKQTCSYYRLKIRLKLLLLRYFYQLIGLTRDYDIHVFFISNTSISNARLKLAKNQAKANNTLRLNFWQKCPNKQVGKF